MTCIIRVLAFSILAFATAPFAPAFAANTGLDTPSGVANLPFSVEGNTVMNLTPAGLGIGIGETNPNSALQVAGEIAPGDSGAACASMNEGSLRYDPSAHSLEYCAYGGTWTPVVSGVPSHAVEAFDLTSCPAGWTLYTPAEGKFLRGIDYGTGYDPAGTRAPGAYEADMVGPHEHYFSTSFNTFMAAWKNVAASYTGYGGAGYAQNVPVAGWTDAGNTGAETRPRNVAVLYCEKN